ncbi:SHOCT domain-containing protein [Halorussus halobius]|uniref:SHOCT domain-containing protein n=1 Tax=Halorussus halobius TaxID=1710537 RepID=UPI001B2FFE75|nr:SHOCT domain-containing protein [Halorussus halobius]
MTFGLVLSGQNAAVALLYLSITVTAFVVAGQLTRGLARQARAAPPIEGYDDPRTDTETETAIDALRRRYAVGELNHDEFQRRLDRLLETEELESTTADRERVFE